MVRLVAILLLSAAPALAGTMPAATFDCRLLVAGTLDGVAPDDFVASPFATITLDGKGGYVHRDGPGTVVLDGKGLLRFTAGTMSGTVAVQRTDSSGRDYLHISGAVGDPPTGLPKFGDFVCYRKP